MSRGAVCHADVSPDLFWATSESLALQMAFWRMLFDGVEVVVPLDSGVMVPLFILPSVWTCFVEGYVPKSRCFGCYYRILAIWGLGWISLNL